MDGEREPSSSLAANEVRRIRRHHTPMSLAPSWLNPARSRDGVLSEPKGEEDRPPTLAGALARAKPQRSSETQEQRFSQALRDESLPCSRFSNTNRAFEPALARRRGPRVHARAWRETAGNRTPGVAVGLTCLIKNSARPPALALPSTRLAGFRSPGVSGPARSVHWEPPLAERHLGGCRQLQELPSLHSNSWRQSLLLPLPRRRTRSPLRRRPSRSHRVRAQLSCGRDGGEVVAPPLTPAFRAARSFSLTSAP